MIRCVSRGDVSQTGKSGGVSGWDVLGSVGLAAGAIAGVALLPVEMPVTAGVPVCAGAFAATRYAVMTVVDYEMRKGFWWGYVGASVRV